MRYLDTHDTIMAIATGRDGAINIIRISGAKALTYLAACTALPSSHYKPRKMHHVAIYTAEHEVFDYALACYFAAPASYSGEDLVEIHTHGGNYIAPGVIEILEHLGARMAEPGEFSYRAVLHNKMHLLQAQAVQELIMAQSDDARNLAINKLQGAHNSYSEKLEHQLKHVLMLAEAGIDFSDQDIDVVNLDHLKKPLPSIISLLEALYRSYETGSRIENGMKVSIIGLPNAGKSSLFNLLVGEDRSIVSQLQGTTRDVIREKFYLKHQQRRILFHLHDTAGIRTTPDTIEQMGIERSHQTAKGSDIVLCLLDAQRAWQHDYQTLKATHVLDTHTVILVFTHMDQLSDFLRFKTQAQTFFETTTPPPIVYISNTNGFGISDLTALMAEKSLPLLELDRSMVTLTKMDQAQAVQKAILLLTSASSATSHDLFASDVWHATKHLAPVLGIIESDTILSSIFSQFCIGK